MALSLSKQELLHLYRRLLRSGASFPSKNAAGIVQSIRDDFRDNKALDPMSEKAQNKIYLARKGLDQLRQFDNRGSTNFAVTLEQNPFPKQS
jgi:hypothetical protein